MGAVTLKLRCPSSVNGIAADPQPDWSFDELLLELNTLESKLNSSPLFTKTHSREFSDVKDNEKGQRSFVMHVSDNEMDDVECDDDKEGHGKPLAVGRRFACHELYLSDSEDSDDESTIGAQCSLMDKGGIVEGALIELSHEHQLSVTEEIRTQIVALETDLVNENEKFTSALSRVKKYAESQRELHRKLDLQYQRRIAEALDNHLTDVQRHHEYKFQIEERKIRDDAAIEEAKRRQKALQEEKARQEILKAEEARLEAEKKRDEEAKVAALEAKRAAKKAVEVVATETLRKAADAMVAPQGTTAKVSGSDGLKKVPAGNILKGAENALKLEERRLQIYKEVAEKNESLGMGSNKEFRRHGAEIVRRMKTINGTNENVRARVGEIVKLLNSSCPQSIGIAMFAEKIVTQIANPTGSFSNTLYAYGHVIVMVTSQVPLAMEILLAELNRVCIYTVPKHIAYSKSAFKSQEDYFKAIGYQEEDGQLESKDSYLQRLTSYMKLYGALVQTEVNGYQNLHGIREGWAWLTRFLNALPANLYTAVALQAFLEVAGFALYRRYKSQFKKLLNIISGDFLNDLKGGEHPRLKMAVTSLQEYIESKFLVEPIGWRLQGSTLSRDFAPNPESDSREHYQSSSGYQDQYQYSSSGYQNQYQNSSNRFRYQR